MDTQQELHIRNARPDEGDTIQAVTLAAYEQYATVMPHWDMYREHLLQTLAHYSPAECIVAERDGVIVGSVLLYPPSPDIYPEATAHANWPEMRLLAVAPAARGLGVGAALLDECMRRARASGARTLGLHTEDIMEVASQMYRRRGFVRAPEYDFSPAVGILVKAYCRDLDDVTLEDNHAAASRPTSS